MFVKLFEQDKLEQHDDRCAFIAVSRAKKPHQKQPNNNKTCIAFTAQIGNDKKTIHTTPKTNQQI